MLPDKSANLRSDLEVGIYGTHATDVSVPKFKMPEGGLRSDVAHALVRDELFLDGNARQNLATFCQTFLNDDVHQLMDISIDKNMIDKDEYPATAELENRCVHILADLWHSPQATTTPGCSTTGSSEACMLGGLALKHKWRARMKAAGKPSDKPNLVTGPVQVCCIILSDGCATRLGSDTAHHRSHRKIHGHLYRAFGAVVGGMWRG